MNRTLSRDIILSTVSPSCPCVGCPDYGDACDRVCKRLARWRDEKAMAELAERGRVK
jgi:hypothetical protein